MKVRMTRNATGLAVTVIAAMLAQGAAAGIDAGGVVDRSKGAVTAVDSSRNIYVNGVRFSTDQAEFVIDGQLGTQADIEVGKVVSIIGILDANGASGTAYIVTYDDAVEGPLAAVDDQSGQIRILGQTVVVTADTNDAVGALDTMNVGETVEVSGFRDAEQRIIATYIGASRAAASYSVRGTVTAVDPAAMTFAINDLVIDYAQAGIFEVADGLPSVGQELKVVGVVDSQTDRLVADQVVPATDGIDAGGGASFEIDGIDAGGGMSSGTDGIDAGGGTSSDIDGIDAGGGTSSDIDGIDAGGGTSSDIDGIDAGGGTSSDVDGIDAGGQSAQVEGYIGNPIDSRSELAPAAVDGTEIRVSRDTRFVNGGADDLSPNRKVDVRGRLDVNGALVADSIEFERAGTEHVAGPVDAVLGDQLIVDGAVVDVTTETSYYDHSSTALRHFTAADLSAGDSVELHGYTTADRFVVTRLERHGAGVDLSGPDDTGVGSHDSSQHDD